MEEEKTFLGTCKWYQAEKKIWVLKNGR